MASTMRVSEGASVRRRPAVLAAGLGLVIAGALVAAGSAPAIAAGVPGSPGYLGAAEPFAVLGGSAVTNTGAPTHVWGDVGVWPGTALVGFTPTQVGGAQHAGDSTAGSAQIALTDAYVAAAAELPTDSIDHAVISGQTFTPGVYHASSAMGFTGTVTLDGGGDPNARWVFQAGTTLTTGSGSRVLVINGNPCNVFWQVGSSATIGSSTAFVGTVMADISVTAVTSATVDGRLLARSGGVTLDSNQITAPDCSLTDSTGTTIPAASPSPSASASASTPPATATPAPSASATPSASAPATSAPTPRPTRTPRATPRPSPSASSTPRAGAPTPTATPTGTATGTGDRLATTGSDVAPPVALAAGLIGAGGLLLALPLLRRGGRRRRPTRA